MFDAIAALGLAPRDAIALVIGLILGISVIFFIRSRQVWAGRRAYGYTVYAADQARRRLIRLSLAGVGAVGLVAGIWWWSSREPAADGEPPPAVAEVREIPDTVLLIPRLAITVNMVEAPVVAQQWDISRLRGEVAHLEGTAYPGEPGNTVLAGHITIPDAGWGPFKDLHTLEPGDRLFIERGTETFVYVVREQLIVAPTDVHVAFPTPHKQLTLITCAEWNDTLETYALRVVVIADQLE